MCVQNIGVLGQHLREGELHFPGIAARIARPNHVRLGSMWAHYNHKNEVYPTI